MQSGWPAVEQGEGTPIVLLHGYPLDHAMWKPQQKGLSRRHRVALLDLPGYGLARDAPVPQTLGGFAEAVARFLADRFSGPVTVGGHSFGGYVALELYRQRPEMFAGLVLTNTRSRADTPEQRTARLRTIERLKDPKERLDTDAVVKSLLAPSHVTRPSVLAQSVRSMIERAPSSSIIPTLRAIADRPDLTPILPTISVPTLVIWGPEDRLIPPQETRSMLAMIPGSVGVEIPGAGHLPSLESPDLFDRVLQEFLSRVDGGASELSTGMVGDSALPLSR